MTVRKVPFVKGAHENHHSSMHAENIENRLKLSQIY